MDLDKDWKEVRRKAPKKGARISPQPEPPALDKDWKAVRASFPVAHILDWPDPRAGRLLRVRLLRKYKAEGRTWYEVRCEKVVWKIDYYLRYGEDSRKPGSKFVVHAAEAIFNERQLFKLMDSCREGHRYRLNYESRQLISRVAELTSQAEAVTKAQHALDSRYPYDVALKIQ